jgi:hypothetical protein
MKAEINDLTHTQFIAQYYGQPCILDYGLLCELHAEDFGTILRNNKPLSLRSISSLTDEEFKSLCIIIMGEMYKPSDFDWNTIVPFEPSSSYVKEMRISSIDGYWSVTLSNGGYISCMEDDSSTNDSLGILAGYDYLRSIGILLPYRGIPEEEIIQNGWAVIRKEETA